MKYYTFRQWMPRFNLEETLEAKDVLLLYREPGVSSGYIPSHKPWLYYLFSALQINNETVNIWTHFLGALAILYNIYVYFTEYRIADDPRLTPLLGFGICCLLNTLLSCVAHTFHSKSPFIHYIAYQADYAGIGYYSLGCGMIVFYFSSRHDWYIHLSNTFMAINFVLSWFGFLCSSIAKLLYQRPYPLRRKLWNICSFGLQGLLLQFIVFSRFADVFGDTGDNFSTKVDHTIVVILLFLSAFFFSIHLPETKWPGKFDIFGQGHHVFHVMSVLLALKQFQTAYKDSQEYRREGHVSHPSLAFVLAYLLVFGVACFVTVLLLRPIVRKRIKKDMEHTD